MARDENTFITNMVEEEYQGQVAPAPILPNIKDTKNSMIALPMKRRTTTQRHQSEEYHFRSVADMKRGSVDSLRQAYPSMKNNSAMNESKEGEQMKRNSSYVDSNIASIVD